MERYFILDKFNTWYDWRLVLTAKSVTPPEPKTNYVELDGMSGTLDLSEALTGEITYKDRTVSASFWTCEGSYKDREKLLRDITAAIHGRKIKIIEPDDPDHYFYGRVNIKSRANNLAYAEFTIEAICEPWRYSIEETVRRVTLEMGVEIAEMDVVLRNNGVKTVCPVINAVGINSGSLSVTIFMGYDETTGGNAYKGITLYDGNYIIPDIKIPAGGVYVLRVGGLGTLTFTYREADL